MSQSKSYSIEEAQVWEAHKRAQVGGGSCGVDRVSWKKFNKKREDNLYKLWNRMASGSYFPPAVRMVEIPKPDGGKRRLGIPTVADRIAQMVVKQELEPEVEPYFHEDSYGYRPKKSALDAVAVTRRRSWRSDWLIDLDIKGFFDNLDHELMMKAVEHHTDKKWVLLYVRRWLEAPVEYPDGRVEERKKGTPQGGVISPLLANLYLHYAFDMWMTREYPEVRFERYADDIVVHCESEKRAKELLKQIRKRLEACKLELHPEKTRIVYCRDETRKGKYEDESFDFLGYTFRQRKVRKRTGVFGRSFLPAASTKAMKRISGEIRHWRIHRKSEQSLAELARELNPKIRGWLQYYGAFYKSRMRRVMHELNRYLMRWVFRKYKKVENGQWAKANKILGGYAKRNPRLFAHWEYGFKPATG